MLSEQLYDPISGIVLQPSSSDYSCPPPPGGCINRRARKQPNSRPNDLARTPEERTESDSHVISHQGDITQLLKRLRYGNREAEAILIQFVYEKLRRLAASYLRRERRDHTLQPTALVHEVYLKLIKQREVSWQNRGHFYRLTARFMRRILVDHARRVKARGGDRKVPMEPELVLLKERPAELLAIDEALDRLAEPMPRQAQVVELRFFAGLSEKEIAQVLNISVRTVKRDWRSAQAWLFAKLSHVKTTKGQPPTTTPPRQVPSSRAQRGRQTAPDASHSRRGGRALCRAAITRGFSSA